MDSHDEDVKVHETSFDPIFNLFERRDRVF